MGVKYPPNCNIRVKNIKAMGRLVQSVDVQTQLIANDVAIALVLTISKGAFKSFIPSHLISSRLK